MIKTFVAFLFLSLTTLVATAQFSSNQSIGTKSLGQGGIGTVQQGIESMRSNQAGIVNLDSWALGLHTERRFGLAGVQNIGLDFATPTKFGFLGLSLGAFGNKTFQQQKIGLAYARKLFKTLSIGAQFDILNTAISNFGNKLNYTYEIGLYSEVFDYLHIGAHIFSPGKISLTDQDPIPSRITYGMKLIVSDKLRILSEFEKSFDVDHDIKFGVEYRIIDPLECRLGVTTREGNYSFGLSYYYKKFAIDLGFAQHPILDSTTALSVRYGINK